MLQMSDTWRCHRFSAGLTQIILSCCVLFSCLTSNTAIAQRLQPDVEPLIKSSCIQCHDAETETALNFNSLGHDLADTDTFRAWERVFDRIQAGEMQPDSEDRPDPK